MINLERRLTRLEALLTDDHGSIPHSPQWRANWTERIDNMLTGEEPHTRGILPLEALDMILAEADCP
ncbi:MAG TPA: hypothetical protein VGN17_01435 [Bryobacteraceae bacterium]|jgi:hypothetical protein